VGEKQDSAGKNQGGGWGGLGFAEGGGLGGTPNDSAFHFSPPKGTKGEKVGVSKGKKQLSESLVVD